MKRVFTLLSVAALALALPGGAVAAEKKPTPAKSADPAKDAAAAKATGETKPMPFSARADSIDAGAKTFTMKKKDGVEVKNVLTDKTEIKNGEAAAKFGDIKTGETVSGLRLKKSDTEYEVVKITKFGVAAPRKPKGEGDAKPAEKKP